MYVHNNCVPQSAKEQSISFSHSKTRVEEEEGVLLLLLGTPRVMKTSDNLSYTFKF